MAVVRLSQLGDLRSLGELLQLAQAIGTTGSVIPPPAGNVGTPAPPRIAPAAATPAAGPGAEGGKKNDRPTTDPSRNGSVTSEPSTIGLTESTRHEVWVRFLHSVGEKYPILAKHLSFSHSYAIFGPNSLVIKFPSAYSEARADCAAEANVQRIQDVLRRVTGQPVSVRFEIDPSVRTPTAGTATVNGTNGTHGAGTANGAAGANGSTAGLGVGDRKRALSALPLFRKASEALGAQIWHVDDEFNPAAPPRPTAQPNASRDPDTDTDEG
jgi:hypothetical protein